MIEFFGTYINPSVVGWITRESMKKSLTSGVVCENDIIEVFSMNGVKIGRFEITSGSINNTTEFMKHKEKIVSALKILGVVN